MEDGFWETESQEWNRFLKGNKHFQSQRYLLLIQTFTLVVRIKLEADAAPRKPCGPAPRGPAGWLMTTGHDLLPYF